MKLQQLRYLAAVAQNGVNITATAGRLNASQSGISKQLRQLEDEIGLPLFERDGRNFTSLTAAGLEILPRALRVLEEVRNIRRLAADARGDRTGTLSIGTTHTQARYVLPEVFRKFRESFPEVDIHLHQGTSEQIANMARLDQIDFAIATGSAELFPGLVRLPCYRWHRKVVVPRGHPLADGKVLTLRRLAEHPIVTYVFSLSGGSSLHEIFGNAGLKPRIALTARDADVVKTYVKLGFGAGLIASMSIEPADLAELVVLDASHLFPSHTTWIGFRRGALLRTFMYEFMATLAPHLETPRVIEAEGLATPAEVDKLFESVALPHAHSISS